MAWASQRRVQRRQAQERLTRVPDLPYANAQFAHRPENSAPVSPRATASATRTASCRWDSVIALASRSIAQSRSVTGHARTTATARRASLIAEASASCRSSANPSRCAIAGQRATSSSSASSIYGPNALPARSPAAAPSRRSSRLATQRGSLHAFVCCPSIEQSSVFDGSRLGRGAPHAIDNGQQEEPNCMKLFDEYGSAGHV